MPKTLFRSRFILVCGVILASIFLVIEFSSKAPSTPSINLPTLDIEGPTQEIRVLLRSHGAPPWILRSESPIVFANKQHQSKAQKEWTIHRRGHTLTLNGRPWIGSATMSREQKFLLNGKQLHGRLRFYPTSLVKRPVLFVPLPRYLSQVLPGEMPLSYPPQALEAQVIASRSYALVKMRRRVRKLWDLTDGETSQMFQSIGKNNSLAQEIVKKTEGIVLTVDKSVLPAYFSANCGGHTRSNQEAFGESPLDPLKGVLCQHCSWSKDYRWSTRISSQELSRITEIALPQIKSVAISKGPGSGYTNTIRLRTDSGTTKISPKRFRARLGNRRIKSDWVTGIDLGQNSLVIGGRGFGHGVGLCQNGASGMARHGHSAFEILNHYYPGARIRQVRKTITP